MREINSRPSEGFESTLYPRIGLYIGGNWIYDRDRWIDVRNPSTGNALGPVPNATPADLHNALEAAEAGFRIWRDTQPLERSRIIMKAVALIRERARDIAKVLTLEHGKTLAAAEGEIIRSCRFYDWEAGQALRSYGWVLPAADQMQKRILRLPIGPVVAFTPWNVPMSAFARKTSAALAAGCSIIVKAANETPGTAVELVKCFEEAGLPPGVLNLVLGDPAVISSTLIGSPISRLVTFTGSTGVGKHLTELAARAMKPALMELGGHAPVIVGRDVDAKAIGLLAAEAKTRASGQICASASRFIVDESVYKPFVDSFAGALNDLRIGDGFDPQAQMGPLANDRRLGAAETMVQNAIARGARVAAGGNRIGNRGFYFEPTLLVDVPLDADSMTVEPFNPIGSCISVPNLDAALKIANSLHVGLAGYAFTNNLTDAERIQRELEVGALSINHFDTPDSDTPFGGVKDSGIGREGGPTSLDAYMVQKTVLQFSGTI
ncbi:NAD-dependent succinate-semialdehyde dehydrogenase [Rhizobium leguminosarum]|uniref:NAD-dependent succinate-semialdehyde dehydrogenase n=1 Tax=Rhizobium TaxID=379 RepID=UPI001C96F9AD|nr:NAD-dependent succinate-semialdehyde dehydrogenase [Rhizobium leguminosarum]MBY5392861.1 NAD-dependent succinate-semialdehyde dehydrogenase [Rhizobium leguminosarum]MBY5434471.1 NAD-dependent succinate-semialdehyde dehydrogenase [Rhizobium leguminosarum]